MSLLNFFNLILVEWVRIGIFDILRSIKMNIIELTGSTKRERIIQAMKCCGWYEGRCVDISLFEKHYGDNLLPIARKFFQEFYGIEETFAVIDGKHESNICFNFTFELCTLTAQDECDFNDEISTIKNTYENDINYIGQIGYYYEGNVWIGKSGKFYSIHEYEDTIRVFNSIWELLEWELSCHEFIRVGIGYYL